MRKKKYIIYTDAGGSSGCVSDKRKYKISLYDSKLNIYELFQLDEKLNTNEAEAYGIVNAMIYAINNKLKNVYIYNDNKSICENKKIQHFAKQNNIKVFWIPNNQNKMADKLIKNNPTNTEYELNNLKLIYNLVMGITKPKNGNKYDHL